MPVRSSLLRARHDKRRRSATPEPANRNLLQVYGNSPVRRSSFTSVTDISWGRPSDNLLQHRSKSSTGLSERRSSSSSMYNATAPLLSSTGYSGSPYGVNGSERRRSSFALNAEATLYVPNRKQMLLHDKEAFRINRLSVVAVFFVISFAVVGVAVLAYLLKI